MAEKGQPSKEDIKIGYYVSLYIIVKILSMHQHYRFVEIYRDFRESWKGGPSTVERDIIILCEKETIYRPTLYENLKNFDENQMRNYVRLVAKYIGPYIGITWRELAEKIQLGTVDFTTIHD
jgi:hypothetical protein